jgi:hypothetical protein
MKTVMTLIVAVGMSGAVWAQADSSVIIGARADSLALTDSSRRADSLLHARIRVLPFPVAIDAVLRDFPNNLCNITGELVLAQGEIETYASLVELPGAVNCMVTRYHSTGDTTASWQAKMYSSDDAGKASQQYHELFRMLQNCTVQLTDGSLLYLRGVWEPVKENASFTTSTFKLSTGNWPYSEVTVELELVYLLSDWAVHINVFSKRRDDEVGGTGTGTGQ